MRAKNGGVNETGYVATLPDGSAFYALKYHGDVAGVVNFCAQRSTFTHCRN